MTVQNENARTEWAVEFLDRWLDSDHQISSEALRRKEWVALPAPDVLSPMEAEWLAEAIRDQGIEEAVGVSCEYNGAPSIDHVQLTRDSLLEYNFNNSYRYILLTSPAESFLYYKDQGNEFYLVCGSANFVSEAYKCSRDTAKIMYFDYWVDDVHNDREKRFLTEIWNKYTPGP